MRGLRWVLLVAASCFVLHAEARQSPDSYSACTVGNAPDSVYPFCAGSFEPLGHMICDHGDYRFDHYDLVGDVTPSAYGANAYCFRISWNQIAPMGFGMWTYGHCPGGGWTPMYMRDGVENQTCPGVDPQCLLDKQNAEGKCSNWGMGGGLVCTIVAAFVKAPEIPIACAAGVVGYYAYCMDHAPTCQ